MLTLDHYKDILNSSSSAIIALDLNLKTTFVNTVAKQLLDIREKQALSSMNLLALNDSLLIENLDFLKENKLDFQKICQHPSYKQLQGYVKGIQNSDNELIGFCAFLTPAKMERKRTFGNLRQKILSVLLERRKTINQIAKDTEINWKTVQHHLTYLAGKKLISEVFSSSYVRIFEITEQGKKFMEDQMYTSILDPHKLDSESLELSKEVER